LADYRPTITPLTEEDREQLIEQAQLMLEQVFVHLPLKRAMHGTGGKPDQLIISICRRCKGGIFGG
jgi:hypothetical protein